MKQMDINYISGWGSIESDDVGSFRWIGEEASFDVSLPPSKGQKYLKITAGHSSPNPNPPVLSVFANGHLTAEKTISPSFSCYAFPFEGEGTITFDLKLDSVFHVEGDPRGLGIMIRSVEFIQTPYQDNFLDGWHNPGTDQESNYRWMKKQASMLIQKEDEIAKPFLKITAGHPYDSKINPVLSIKMGEVELCKQSIEQGMNSYVFHLKTGVELANRIELILDKTFDSNQSNDSRELGIQVKEIELIDLQKKQFIFGENWMEEEEDKYYSFRWISNQAVIYIDKQVIQKNKFVAFNAFSEYVNFTQELSISLNDTEIESIPLCGKWNFYCFSFENHKEIKPLENSYYKLQFNLNKTLPDIIYPNDKRTLGIRFSEVQIHSNEEERQISIDFHKNALLNYQEMTQGKTQLQSFPLSLGIDLYAKCNINPPCVYCLWHKMKDMEGDYKSANVDEKTLLSYGPFFKSARILVNCSFGEPLLHPRLKEILEFFQKNKKFLELSTNGQAFNKERIESLAGKDIHLYISLDSASKETYSKIRNDRWESIIPNLKLLNEVRKKHGNLPKIYMVFMPMRVNRNDLEDYFKLCQLIDADSIVLRPLLYLIDPKIKIDRGGYHFDYKNELLSREEYEDIFKKCDELSLKYNVEVANQFDFGILEEKKSVNRNQLDEGN